MGVIERITVMRMEFKKPLPRQLSLTSCVVHEKVEKRKGKNTSRCRMVEKRVLSQKSSVRRKKKREVTDFKILLKNSSEILIFYFFAITVEESSFLSAEDFKVSICTKGREKDSEEAVRNQ